MMLDNTFKSKKKSRGFTLIELLLVIPLISIILIVAFNIIFITSKNFLYTKDSFSIYEQMKIFQTNIQKEANQARKANENKDVIEKINGRELHIYTDINGDNIPEIVRYMIVGNELIREVKYSKLSSQNQYPYTYGNDWINRQVVLNNVEEKDFINEILDVKKTDVNIVTNKIKDHRKKTTINLNVKSDYNDKEIKLSIGLVTKSRAEAN